MSTETNNTAMNPDDYASVAPATDPMAAKIAQWKQQNREVTEIRVMVAPGDEAVCYLKNPDRNITAYALTRTMNKQLLEAGEFLLRNCWLGGDERLNPDSPQAFDPAIIAASMEAAQCVEMLASTSKKL